MQFYNKYYSKVKSLLKIPKYMDHLLTLNLYLKSLFNIIHDLFIVYGIDSMLVRRSVTKSSEILIQEQEFKQLVFKFTHWTVIYMEICIYVALR